MSQLHVAILDEELPFPLNSGKRIRTFNLVSRLAARHRITYLCHRNPDAAETVQATQAMANAGIRTIVVDRPIPEKRGIGFYARLVGNLLSPLPYSVSTHRSPELLEAAKQLAKDDPPDLWHCEWTPYAEYLRQPFSDAPWIVMAHNVESLIWRRMFEAERNPAKRWYIKQQMRKFERFESWAYSACSTAIAVSEPDARIIRSRFGGKRVAVVDNGVDTGYFTPDQTPRHDPHRLLFLGSLDWRPNIDGVRMLLEEIFPQVRAAEPRATLQIVGRKPAEWLHRLAASRPGVELHADVADVRPFLAGAGMLVVPLRIGGGSRLKILESLASGLPVVTTRVGVEGLNLDPDAHVTLADTPVQMVEAIQSLIGNRDDARRQANHGRNEVLEHYDWSRLANQLEAVWLASLGLARSVSKDVVSRSEATTREQFGLASASG